MKNALFDVLALGVPHLHCEGPVRASGALRREANGCCPLEASDAGRRLAGEDLRVAVEPGAAAAVAQGVTELGAGAAYLGCGARRAAGSRLSGVPALEGVHVLPDMQPASLHDAHRLSLTDPAAHFIGLRRYGRIAAGDVRSRAILAGSARLLCLEDCLWDVEGGPHLAEAMVAVAGRAGRRTALFCRDAETVHRNRAEIRRLADSRIDFLVGEVQALVALYDYQRLDSLIPRLRALDRGGVVWRPNHPPLVFGGEMLAWRRCAPPPAAAAFWREVLPEYLVEIARTGSLEAYAPPGPSRSRQAMEKRGRGAGDGEACV